MKIAIAKGRGSFDVRWEAYCQRNGIDYKIVNPYSSEIVKEVEDCEAFMWHHHHGECPDPLFAKQLLYSLQTAGKKVFPDWHTTWHFDDKVGQKYLLESVGAPLVPSYVFYTKKDALEWIGKTTFPKVFKLRGGASASNVILVESLEEAKKLIKKAFGKGFKHNNSLNNLKERIRLYREGKKSFMIIIKGLVKLVFPDKSLQPDEKGYVYFQDFIPNNYFDIRIISIGDKAFAIKRMVQNGDFRTSGSGNIHYERSEIPEECVKISFDVAEKIKSQSLALDFVFGLDGNPMIVEASYGFSPSCYDDCLGYWTKDMQWHEGPINPQEWVIEGMKRDFVGGIKLNLNDLKQICDKYHITISSKQFDLRVVVIGDKAMCEKRYAREGDFRASGSGKFEYVPLRDDVLNAAFSTAQKLHLQSVAFDFIFRDNEPLIVEISYAFGTHGISHCPGYYTKDHQWHGEAEPDFYAWMVEGIKNNKSL